MKLNRVAVKGETGEETIRIILGTARFITDKAIY